MLTEENKDFQQRLARLEQGQHPVAVPNLPASPQPEESEEEESVSVDLNHSSAPLHYRPPEPDQGGGNAPSLLNASLSPGSSHPC